MRCEPRAQVASQGVHGSSSRTARRTSLRSGSKSRYRVTCTLLTKGLIYVSEKGGWTSTAIKDPITAVARDRAGWLWIASATGLITRKPSGDTLRIGAAQGLAITTPRLLVELPGDRMLVIGTDETGRERVAFGKELAWQTYRALPEVTWDAATRRTNGALVMGGGRVYRIGLADPTRVRPLARDGMRLVPITGGTASEWEIDAIYIVVPPGATSLGVDTVRSKLWAARRSKSNRVRASRAQTWRIGGAAPSA